MLIDIDDDKVIDRVPFQREFDTLRSRLSGAEFDAMVTRIDQLIDEGRGGNRDRGLAARQRLDGDALRGHLHQGGAR